MFQSEKKPGNSPVNKNQENAKTTANSPDYYSIMQEQNNALNSINTPLQLKEEEEKELLQAKAAPVQRMVKEEEEEMQMKQGGEESKASLDSTPVFSKMNAAIQAKMENSFGTSFSDVNIIHNDPSAKHMGALAYTRERCPLCTRTV